VRTPDDDRPTPTRARRAIALAIGFYLCGQIGAGFALDHAPLRVRFPQAARVMREAAEQPPDVLILGSSRFKASVVTGVMDGELCKGDGERPPVLLNAAVEAGDGYAMDLVLRGLIATGARPRLALIEISPETLARRNGWMNAHIARQLTFSEEAAILPQIALSKRMDMLVSARLNSVYFYRRELLIWITGRKRPFLRVPDPAEQARESSEAESNVAPPANRSEADPEEAARQFRQRSGRGARHIRKWLRNYEISGLAAESLDRLLQRCRAHGIEVILIGPPVAGVHRAVYTDDIESAFQAYMKGLSERHHVRYLDYRDRLTDDRFIDNHHTNPKGALEFSRLLARDVVRPSWPACDKSSGRRSKE